MMLFMSKEKSEIMVISMTESQSSPRESLSCFRVSNGRACIEDHPMTSEICNGMVARPGRRNPVVQPLPHAWSCRLRTIQRTRGIEEEVIALISLYELAPR